MKTLSRTFIAVALVLALAGAAQAAVLFTPPLATSGTNTLVCRVANLSSGSITATLEIFTGLGVIADSGSATILANPSQLVIH